MQKTKKRKIRKEKPKIQEEKVAASLLPVLIELNKKVENGDTAKEETTEPPLTTAMIDLIVQQKLS